MTRRPAMGQEEPCPIAGLRVIVDGAPVPDPAEGGKRGGHDRVRRPTGRVRDEADAARIALGVEVWRRAGHQRRS